MRKLLTVAKNTPEAFDFPRRMEEQYGHVMPQRMKDKGYFDGKKRVFFRKETSTLDILRRAKLDDFHEYSDDTQQLLLDFFSTAWDEELDIGGGCGDSCEIGADE